MLSESGTNFDSVDGTEDSDDPMISGCLESVPAELAVFLYAAFRDQPGSKRVVALGVPVGFSRESQYLVPALPGNFGELFMLDGERAIHAAGGSGICPLCLLES